MKIIRNNFIPFKGFKAINLFGVLFVRNGSILSKKDMNHERIHTAQMKEMLYVFFYLWYFVEWIVKLFIYGKKAYKNISFEKEAYCHEDANSYLEKRVPYEWFSFL